MRVRVYTLGPERWCAIGKKILEEAGEVWLAAEHESDEALAEEISQLIYHVQTLMLARGLSLDDVYTYL